MGSPNEIASHSATDLDVSNEKISAVAQTDVEDLSKSDLHIDDEAGVVAAKALASGPADAEISKKVLRKIDLYILPFLCITYGKFKKSNAITWQWNLADLAPRSRSPILGQDIARIFECFRNYHG